MDKIPIPAKVRFALYLLSAVGSVVVSYLVAKGYIGDAETALWAGIVAVVNGIAAAKTNLDEAQVSVAAPPGSAVAAQVQTPDANLD